MSGRSARQRAKRLPANAQYTRTNTAAVNAKPVISWMKRIVPIVKPGCPGPPAPLTNGWWM